MKMNYESFNKNIKIRKCTVDDVDSIYNIKNIVIDNFKEEEKGWQIKMEIPKEVWKAYEILVKRGYDRFVLKDQEDEGVKKNIEVKLRKL